MIDYHIHSFFSFDSNSALEEIVRNAIDKKLTSICISDHYDYNYPNDDFTMDIKLYYHTIALLKEKYKNEIDIKIGIEIGLDLNYKKKIHNLLASYDFDYIIGSIHVINNTEFYYGEFFKDKTQKQANLEYFNTVLACINEFKEIDCLAHLDYIIRYGNNTVNSVSYQEYNSIIDKILNSLISNNIALEINTSGLTQGYQQPFPSYEIIDRYFSFNGKLISIGSDAHHSHNVGNYVNDIYVFLSKYKWFLKK